LDKRTFGELKELDIEDEEYLAESSEDEEKDMNIMK
jgi:hypothetical protein